MFSLVIVCFVIFVYYLYNFVILNILSAAALKITSQTKKFSVITFFYLNVFAKSFHLPILMANRRPLVVMRRQLQQPLRIDNRQLLHKHFGRVQQLTKHHKLGLPQRIQTR